MIAARSSNQFSKPVRVGSGAFCERNLQLQMRESKTERTRLCVANCRLFETKRKPHLQGAAKSNEVEIVQVLSQPRRGSLFANSLGIRNRYEFGYGGSAQSARPRAGCWRALPLGLGLRQRATDENQKGGCCSEDAEKDVRSRVEIVENLRCAGLITSTVKSQDGTQFVIRIGATDDRLEKHAEYIKLQLPTIIPREPGDTSTEEILGDYSAFVSAATDPRKRALFPKVFPSYCRQELIRDIIETRMLRYPGKYPGYDRGANIDINKNIAQGKILQCFPLHDQATVDELMDTWAKAPLKVQPIDRVREYFGEKIALYFSFIGFYTTRLWIPAFIGIGVYILQSVLRVVDTYITPSSCLMILYSCCSTLKHNAAQALHWNVLGYEERDVRGPVPLRAALAYAVQALTEDE